MVPGWGVVMAPTSFGQALLEIAARFAEETSSRLDRRPNATPSPSTTRSTSRRRHRRRPPPPSSSSPRGAHHDTSAPLRAQVGATVEDQEVIFETTRALEVSPARIADVVAVDPDTDHIEQAPGRVVATERPPDPVGGRLW